MAMNPVSCPTYGGQRIYITYSQDYPLPENGDFYVVFEGEKQRHVTSVQQINPYTLEAAIPEHDRAEAVSVTVYFGLSDTLTLLSSQRFDYVLDTEQILAQCLANAAGDMESLQTLDLLNSLVSKHVNSRGLLESLDMQLSRAFQHLILPPNWTLLSEGINGVDEAPASQNTLLHFASQMGLQQLGGALLTKPGAHRALNAKDKNGLLPVEIAKQNGLVQLSQLMLACPDTDKVKKTRDQNKPVVKTHEELGTATITSNLTGQENTLEKDIEMLRDINSLVKEQMKERRNVFKHSWPVNRKSETSEEDSLTEEDQEVCKLTSPKSPVSPGNVFVADGSVQKTDTPINRGLLEQNLMKLKEINEEIQRLRQLNKERNFKEVLGNNASREQSYLTRRMSCPQLQGPSLLSAFHIIQKTGNQEERQPLNSTSREVGKSALLNKKDLINKTKTGSSNGKEEGNDVFLKNPAVRFRRPHKSDSSPSITSKPDLDKRRTWHVELDAIENGFKKFSEEDIGEDEEEGKENKPKNFIPPPLIKRLSSSLGDLSKIGKMTSDDDEEEDEEKGQITDSLKLDFTRPRSRTHVLEKPKLLGAANSGGSKDDSMRPEPGKTLTTNLSNLTQKSKSYTCLADFSYDNTNGTDEVQDVKELDPVTSNLNERPSQHISLEEFLTNNELEPEAASEVGALESKGLSLLDPADKKSRRWSLLNKGSTLFSTGKSGKTHSRPPLKTQGSFKSKEKSVSMINLSSDPSKDHKTKAPSTPLFHRRGSLIRDKSDKSHKADKSSIMKTAEHGADHKNLTKKELKSHHTFAYRSHDKKTPSPHNFRKNIGSETSDDVNGKDSDKEKEKEKEKDKEKEKEKEKEKKKDKEKEKEKEEDVKEGELSVPKDRGSPAGSMGSLDDDEGSLNIEGLSDSDLEIKEEAESWSVTVDKKLLKRMTAKEIKRQDVIHEFIQTEAHHIRTLKIMQKVFYKGFLDEVALTQETVDQLFPALAELLEFNGNFLNKLKTRQEQSSVIENIGDIFVEQFSNKNAETMVDIYGAFCGNHRKSVALYKDLYKTDKHFANFIHRCRMNKICRRLSVPECITLITQRTTKYPLLIEAIIKQTKESKSDYEPLKSSLQLIKNILSAVDAKITDMEKQQRLDEIIGKLDLKGIVMYKGGKRLRNVDLPALKSKMVHDGVLSWKNARGKLTETLVVLLDDRLVFLYEKDQKYSLLSIDQKVPVIKLKNVMVREVATDAKAFFLLSTSKDGPEMYEVVCTTVKEKKKWISTIKEAINQCPDERYGGELLPSAEAVQKKSEVMRIKDTLDLIESNDAMDEEMTTHVISEVKELVSDLEPSGKLAATLDGETDPLRARDTLLMAIQQKSLSSAVHAHDPKPMEKDSLALPAMGPKRSETFGGFDTKKGDVKDAMVSRSSSMRQDILRNSFAHSSSSSGGSTRSLDGATSISPKSKVKRKDSGEHVWGKLRRNREDKSGSTGDLASSSSSSPSSSTASTPIPSEQLMQVDESVEPISPSYQHEELTRRLNDAQRLQANPRKFERLRRLKGDTDTDKLEEEPSPLAPEKDSQRSTDVSTKSEDMETQEVIYF